MTDQERKELERIEKETRLHTDSLPHNNGRIFRNEVVLSIRDFDFLLKLAKRAEK